MAGLPDGFFLTELQETDSTSNVAKKKAAEGAAHGTVVTARRQTGGRGRRGNVWESPEGNLYASFVMRPRAKAAEAGQISFLCGLAVAEALDGFLTTDKKPLLKWPNDVLIGLKKIAGILLEAEIKGDNIDWVVAGIGVNLVPVSLETATSLAQEGAKAVMPGQILEKLAERLKYWLDLWQTNGFAPVRKAWLNRAAGIGGALTARLPDGEIRGIFSGINEEGALILSLPDGGTRLVSSGEVYF